MQFPLPEHSASVNICLEGGILRLKVAVLHLEVAILRLEVVRLKVGVLGQLGRRTVGRPRIAGPHVGTVAY